jgi:dolichol-phosphate mannosyltransferase
MTEFDVGAYGGAVVAAVIPARNEARTIADLVRRSQPYAHRVVVMDGRSNDGTPELAQAAGATVVQDPGRGKGSAVRAALATVEADVVVFMDADGSHDPADIPRLALPIARGDADLVVGSRFAGGSDELSVNVGQLIRTIGNISMNIAINTRWHVSLTDTLNGYRAVRRAAALAVGLREDRHTIEQEMVMGMLRHRYRVVNVPTHEYARQFGDSHINIWREWPKFVWCVVVNLVPRDSPLHAELVAALPGATGTLEAQQS